MPSLLPTASLHSYDVTFRLKHLRWVFSSKDIQLFNEAGIDVENKNYTNDEVERLKIKVTEFIISQSTKDIDKYSKKFSSLL